MGEKGIMLMSETILKFERKSLALSLMRTLLKNMRVPLKVVLKREIHKIERILTMPAVIYNGM